MEDHRLPDTADHHKCPAEGCREYEFLIKRSPDDPGTYHCFIHSPHCLQVGHTNGADPEGCERAHQHPGGAVPLAEEPHV